MKIKILRSKLIEALKAVQNIVAGRGSLPIIQNVLMEAENGKITLTTTDLDISIRSVCECEVIEPGRSTLPVKLLFNAVAKSEEGAIEIEIDNKECARISAGHARFRLVGMPAADFPKLPSDEDAYSYSVPQQTVKEMLRKVAYAASQDDTRRTIKCVLMRFKDEKLTMVATDGRRLALVEKEIEFSKSDERDIVLPSKAVAELQRTLLSDGDAAIMLQKSQVCFNLGSVTIYSKIMEDAYPNYVQVIPKETAEHISVDRQQLIDALERVSVMTIDEAHSTKLIFESGKLTVSATASDIGDAKDEVPIKYAGETIEIVFNPSYLMDSLKVIDDDEVTINLNDGHSPAVITCSIPFLYVLMPLRIS